jgi:SAM-dependent methyltransferase
VAEGLEDPFRKKRQKNKFSGAEEIKQILPSLLLNLIYMGDTITATETLNKTLPPTALRKAFSDCLVYSKNKTRGEWIIEKLRIQSYQHILEIGFTDGVTLEKAANKLQIGLLAGIDESIRNYQKAFKRNRKFMQRQLLELHLGKIADLPYPHNYFHTIYGNNIYNSWQKPQNALIQLVNLLNWGGKLVMVFQPADALTEKEIWQAAENMQYDYGEAGLTDISIAYRDMAPATCIAVTGYKT